MWAYTDEEIDYLSSTRADTKSALSATPHPDNAEGSEDASAAVARDGSDARALRAAHPSRVSWAQIHGAAKQLLARLDPAVARLNTALVIVAAFLAYVDIVVYFALKAWALDVDWAALLRACGST